MTDRAALLDVPWEFVWGYYPSEYAARDAYNSLYPEGERSGYAGQIIESEPGRFRLALTSWPEASREARA